MFICNALKSGIEDDNRKLMQKLLYIKPTLAFDKELLKQQKSRKEMVTKIQKLYTIFEGAECIINGNIDDYFDIITPNHIVYFPSLLTEMGLHVLTAEDPEKIEKFDKLFTSYFTVN